ncbi:MAG: hypothetical protein JSS63_05690 [Bacteroidetes bacterium]|nr:hypothetical protein [Bacteroidota bacterium]MBX7045199.1 hypothetical protein [Ignavibacteria bacterium]
MYENKKQKLISQKAFRSRVIRNLVIFLILLVVSLFIGMIGYHYLGELGWVDSFLEACMILGGMGPVSQPKNDAVKIFAGCYAIFCGVLFLSGITFLISPFWHRELHKFHLADEDDEEEENKRVNRKK